MSYWLSDLMMLIVASLELSLMMWAFYQFFKGKP